MNQINKMNRAWIYMYDLETFETAVYSLWRLFPSEPWEPAAYHNRHHFVLITRMKFFWYFVSWPVNETPWQLIQSCEITFWELISSIFQWVRRNNKVFRKPRAHFINMNVILAQHIKHTAKLAGVSELVLNLHHDLGLSHSSGVNNNIFSIYLLKLLTSPS